MLQNSLLILINLHSITYVKELIEERLESEMSNLENYLRSTGDPNIISLIQDGSEEGKQFYSESGDTYKWVFILRAADIHWSTKDASAANIALFRLREEGLVGDSPQIIVKCKNRYLPKLIL